MRPRFIIAVFCVVLTLMPFTARAGMPACTEMGCTDGFTIDVPPDYKWPFGAYTFTFMVVGKTTVCKGSLPLKDCESRSITCDKPGITIMESGCALPPESQGFGMITLDSFPRTLDLKIEHDGEIVVQRSFNPVYTDMVPNGAQCEPKCRQATVRLDE